MKHSYGAKPNEDYLLYYGFVDTENIQDAYRANLWSYVTEQVGLDPGRLQAVQDQPALLQALQQVTYVCQLMFLAFCCHSQHQVLPFQAELCISHSIALLMCALS